MCIVRVVVGRYYVATVLTVYGIETILYCRVLVRQLYSVATVLTVYGIETVLVVTAKQWW